MAKTAQRWLVISACTFEVVAITTGRVPTFTELSARHKWLAPVILSVLALHLYRQPREVAGPWPTTSSP